ncbi:hypothetical protein NFI96_024404, partial [Prochilodus magdalenae]
MQSLSAGHRTPAVKVRVHDPAVLPCSERCSGVAEWTLPGKPRDVLAQCNQTSCQSKEGFQMRHDEYLKGSPALRITDADFSKRNTYTCSCDGVDIYDVRLQIHPLSTPVQIVYDRPVEVIYTSEGAAGPGGLIGTVDGRSLQFKPGYAERVTLRSVLQLGGMMPSDSGVYTIRHSAKRRGRKEKIHIYSVTVRDDHPASDRATEDAVPQWLVLLMGAALLGVSAISLVLILWQRGEIQQLRTEGQRKRREDFKDFETGQLTTGLRTAVQTPYLSSETL